MTTVNIHDAKSRLSQLIKAALEGEEVIITNRNRPVARLTPYEESKPDPLEYAGSLKDRIRIHDPDWDAPMSEESADRFLHPGETG